MVGDNSHSHLSILRLMILMSGKFLDLADHAGEHVSVIVALLSLENHAETFEAHTGIDIVIRKKLELTVGLSVVLHEHEVPNLDYERIALVHQLAPRHLRDLFIASQVNVNFTARAAWTCVTHFPEVIVLVTKKYVIFREILQPCLAGFLIERSSVLS